VDGKVRILSAGATGRAKSLSVYILLRLLLLPLFVCISGDRGASNCSVEGLTDDFSSFKGRLPVLVQHPSVISHPTCADSEIKRMIITKLTG